LPIGVHIVQKLSIPVREFMGQRRRRRKKKKKKKKRTD